VAKSTSGKWVSRVGAAGGGKAYQKSRPGNYYGILAVIVVLGLALTVYSRYEYQNPVKKHSTAVAPVIGSTRYAALSIESCGKKLSYLNSDPTFKGGFTVALDNVIRLTPASAADAGNNATLKQFAAEFPGLLATSTEIAVPTATGSANPKTTYKNGQLCPSTSKYAGQKGKVVYAFWTTLAQKTPTLTTNPAKIKFVKDLRVTMAFEPTGVTPTPPSATTVDAMFASAITPTTTTAGIAPTTTTTGVAPTTTTTTKNTTTTTSKG
jgi:hypothetical protein